MCLIQPCSPHVYLPLLLLLHRLADMFFGGEALLKRLHRSYQRQLPLLIYHGTEDKVRRSVGCPLC